MIRDLVDIAIDMVREEAWMKSPTEPKSTPKSAFSIS